MLGSSQRLRIGIIGAGEGMQCLLHMVSKELFVLTKYIIVTQIIHLPTLCQLSHLYEITAVCDLSNKVCRIILVDQSQAIADKLHFPRMPSTAQKSTTFRRQVRFLRM
jgi:predicted dehydrogenase